MADKQYVAEDFAEWNFCQKTKKLEKAACEGAATTVQQIVEDTAMWPGPPGTIEFNFHFGDDDGFALLFDLKTEFHLQIDCLEASRDWIIGWAECFEELALELRERAKSPNQDPYPDELIERWAAEDAAIGEGSPVDTAMQAAYTGEKGSPAAVAGTEGENLPRESEGRRGG